MQNLKNDEIIQNKIFSNSEKNINITLLYNENDKNLIANKNQTLINNENIKNLNEKFNETLNNNKNNNQNNSNEEIFYDIPDDGSDYPSTISLPDSNQNNKNKTPPNNSFGNRQNIEKND